MFPPFDPDADAPEGRWAVRLDEPHARPVPHDPGPDFDTPDTLPFALFTLDVPTLEFQPRLSRFGEAA
jgi:hypothetical protein